MAKKKLYSLYIFVMIVADAAAQGNGASGINQATQMVTSYFDPATKLIYAIRPTTAPMA